MKVQRSHLHIAVIVLAVLVLYSVYSWVKPAPGLAGPQTPQPPLLGEPVPQATGYQIDPLAIPAPVDVDLTRAPGWSRDPFLFGDETRSLIVPAAAQLRGADPVVRSILFSSTRRLAIVNGKIVAVGDMVGAYKVAEIEQAAVTFALASGERRRVPVFGAARTGLTR